MEKMTLEKALDYLKPQDAFGVFLDEIDGRQQEAINDLAEPNIDDVKLRRLSGEISAYRAILSLVVPQ